MSLLKVQGLCGRGGRTIARARDGGWRQENNIIQTQQDCYTWELTETMTAHTEPTQVQAWQNPSTEKERWTQDPSPNQEAVCNRHLLGKGCLNGMSLGISTTFQGKPHSQELSNPIRLHLYIRVCVYAHTHVFALICYFLSYWCFICLFVLREGGGERERMKLGGNDLGGIGGRERYT